MRLVASPPLGSSIVLYLHASVRTPHPVTLGLFRAMHAYADTACHGITVIAGDPATLTPAAHNISGNLIHRFARIHRTYNPGISWGGVGSLVSNNTIRDAPHAAILGGGVNYLFEHNVIERVAYEVDDAGAFYTGRSWLDRGNVVRSNEFRSIRTRVPVFLGSPSVQGLYLDDQMSDYTVVGNTFIDCQ